MEAVRTSETSVSFYETARRNIPEGCHLRTRRRENLKSQNIWIVWRQTSRFVVFVWDSGGIWEEELQQRNPGGVAVEKIVGERTGKMKEKDNIWTNKKTEEKEDRKEESPHKVCRCIYKVVVICTSASAQVWKLMCRGGVEVKVYEP
jgi:hypothetical protein